MRDLLHFYKNSKAQRKLIDEIFVTFTVFLASLFVFILLATYMGTKEFISIDNTITQFIYSFRSPAMLTFMLTLTSFGDDILIIIAIIFLILLILAKHQKEAILFWFLASLGTLFNYLLKSLYQRPRPLGASLTSYSFPSGHSMVSFIFYMSLAYFIFHHMRNKNAGIILALLFFIVVLGIGISRIYLGVHYPSDVVAGYAAGLAWLCIALVIEKVYTLLRIKV